MRNRRGIFSITIRMLIVILIMTNFGGARALALIVPDNYPTIQTAIDAASPGDTIVVRSGTYFENLTLNKSIILTAEFYDPNDPTHYTTIIDGRVSGSLSTVTILASLLPGTALASQTSG